MDRNVARTSASVDAGGDLVVRARAPRPQRVEGRPVDRGVLADLERGEVEAERRHLPAQVGELAPRDARQPVGDERLLERPRARRRGPRRPR